MKAYTKTPQCNFCKRPATVWFKYYGYIAKARPYQPLITTAACSEHEPCPTFQQILAAHPDARMLKAEAA